MIRGFFKLCWAMLLLTGLVLYWMTAITFWVAREVFHRLNSLRRPKRVEFYGHPGYGTSPPKPLRPLMRRDKIRAALADIRANAV
jgi:hypothetical protein